MCYSAQIGRDCGKFVLLLFFAVVALSERPSVFGATPTGCVYDRKALMSMDEQHFDQDLSNGGGGWRALASKPECQIEAADLLRDYRVAHGTTSRILYWHEGQVRATAGDYVDAISLLEKSRQIESEDHAGWNAYVDATVAFLRKNRPALDAARLKLAAVKPDANTVVKDGFVEVMTNGQTARYPWPLNLNVVDALRQCFDRPYAVAYGSKDCATVPKTGK